MEKKEIDGYVSSYPFKLKDYDKTKKRHEKYKPEKWEKIKKKIDIGKFLAVSHEMAFDYLMEENQILYDFLASSDYTKKSSIRHLATRVNHWFNYQNKNQLQEMFDLNENEATIFSVKLYIENYETINRVMRLFLSLLINHYLED